MKDRREKYAERRSGIKPPNQRPRQPDLQALDAAVAKVGQDFPALGPLVRLGWTATA
jgi:hypothetical protein